MVFLGRRFFRWKSFCTCFHHQYGAMRVWKNLSIQWADRKIECWWLQGQTQRDPDRSSPSKLQPKSSIFRHIYIIYIYIDDIYHISFLWMVKCFSYIYVSPLPHCCCCSHLHSVAVYLGFQLSAFLRRWHWFATAMGPLWCRSSSTLGLRSPSISSKFDRRKRDIKNNFCLKQIESYKSYISYIS